MRVLLIDDHELVWNGTRRLLLRVAEDFAWAPALRFRAVRDVPSACALSDFVPELVLLDYHLPGCAGLAALQRIQERFENATVCVVSADCGAEAIRTALEAGAAGYIPKAYREDDMASALRCVLQSKLFVPQDFLVTEDAVRDADTPPEADLVNAELAVFLRDELSPRQREVLNLALQGLSNKVIARRLGIAEATVKVHLSMVYRALGVKNRVGALCRVLQADAGHALA